MRANILTIVLLLFCFFTKAQKCELSYTNEVKEITINDSLIIAYKEQGEGRKTFLMIHGLGGNLMHWNNNFIKNQHCIAIDLPSHGLSTMKNFQSNADLLDFYAETIIAFIQQKKLKNVLLIGHSMGGQIAIITALKNHKSIKKLILVSPAGFEIFEDSEAKALISFAKPETFKNQNEAMVRMGFKRNFYEMPVSTETLIQDRLMMARCEKFNLYFQAVANGVKGMLEHPVRKELNKIKVPTLIIFAENDELIPNKFLHKSLTINQVADIGKDIPKAKIVLIPKAGHLLMYEQSQIFNQLVKHF